jgi:hypothetical protein
MDDLREAAQQALEVLESWSGMRSLWDAEDQKALDTLRAALEQPEQVKVPQFRKVNCADWYDGYADHDDGYGPYEQRVLYTHPPRREWQSLTEEEIDMIYAQPQTHKGQYARAIEAALKERNT